MGKSYKPSLKFLDDQNQEECQKKVKEGNWESRGAQKTRREHGLRNFAAKVRRCENGFPL